MGIKSKIQHSTDFIKDRADAKKHEVSFTKEILNFPEIVYLKTDAIAILIKKKGETKKFFEEFDKITREGYELKSQEQIFDPIPKLNIVIGVIYYFQNRKFTT